MSLGWFNPSELPQNLFDLLYYTGNQAYSYSDLNGIGSVEQVWNHEKPRIHVKLYFIIVLFSMKLTEVESLGD